MTHNVSHVSRNVALTVLCIVLGSVACSKINDNSKDAANGTTAGSVNLPAVDANNHAAVGVIFDGNACNAFVDNANVGLPCNANFGTGVYVCVRGEVSCQVCSPNQTRVVACPCGLVETDTCSDQGTWQKGLCNVCPQSITGPGTCDAADACTPGDVKYQPCDIPQSPNNALPCNGQQFTCNSGCQWVMTSDCAPRAPQCNAFQTKVETCSLCGSRTVTCPAGCFWQELPCQHQGVCNAGETVLTPCAGEANACAQGVATTTCNGSCQWDPPTSCTTCTPDSNRQITQPCQQFDSTKCGNAYVTQKCEKTPFPTCAGVSADANAYAWTSTTQVDMSQCLQGNACGGAANNGGGCPTSSCANTPPVSQSCTTSDDTCGVAGTQTVQCKANGCGLETTPCQPLQSVACQSGDTQQIACPGCRPGYYRQEVCVQCNWSVKSDPCSTCF